MSSRSRQSKERKNKSIIIIIYIIVFWLGYYLLNHIATLEDPPIGPIFNIIVGCVLMAISLLLTIITIRKMFFKKRRSGKSRQVFLKKEHRNSDSN